MFFTLPMREKNAPNTLLLHQKNESISLSLDTSAIYVYIKPKHDCRIMPFTYLLIFNYRFLLNRRTAKNDNAEGQSNGLFNRPFGIGDDKLHGPSSSRQSGGSSICE
jgi:hypothetical protein